MCAKWIWRSICFSPSWILPQKWKDLAVQVDTGWWFLLWIILALCRQITYFFHWKNTFLHKIKNCAPSLHMYRLYLCVNIYIRKRRFNIEMPWEWLWYNDKTKTQQLYHKSTKKVHEYMKILLLLTICLHFDRYDMTVEVIQYNHLIF